LRQNHHRWAATTRPRTVAIDPRRPDHEQHDGQAYRRRKRKNHWKSHLVSQPDQEDKDNCTAIQQ
jgi:hypothetical protein